MQDHALYGIISQLDEEQIKTSTQIEKNKIRNDQLKSDQEILHIYKKMIGDSSQDKPLPRIWQEQINSEKEKFQTLDSPSKNTKPNMMLQKQSVQNPIRPKKSFELSSLSPQRQKRLPMTKNTTNYSQGYKQTKPFSLKKEGKATVVYANQTTNIVRSPEISVNGNTTDHFVKKLNSNIVKDKGEYSSRIGKVAMQIRVQDKRLKDQIKKLNKQQMELQASIRHYHQQYKQYCKDIEEKHGVNINIEEIRSNKQILTLEPQQQSSKLVNKKAQLIQQYQVYTDKLEHEIRKIDALVSIKKQNIRKQEMSIEASRLYALLQQPVQEKIDQETQEKKPIVSGPTYRQIMKARKNKNFSKLQHLIGQPKEEQNVNHPPLLNQISGIQKQEQTQLYENENGQVRVNENLRNLLLN